MLRRGMINWGWCIGRVLDPTMRMLVTIPTLAGRRFTYVAYLDDSGSCFPFPAEENLNAQRTQRGLCPPQATGERAWIFWPPAPGKAITRISQAK